MLDAEHKNKKDAQQLTQVDKRDQDEAWCTPGFKSLQEGDEKKIPEAYSLNRVYAYVLISQGMSSEAAKVKAIERGRANLGFSLAVEKFP